MSQVQTSAQIYPHISAISEDMILLSWPEKVCPLQHQHIIDCQLAILDNLSKVLIDTVISYHTLAIYYRFDLIDTIGLTNTSALCQSLKHIVSSVKASIKVNNSVQRNTKEQIASTVNIPVYYGEEAAWDMLHVAEQCNLTPEQIIHFHTNQSYHAYAQGFTPGFCYLADLPQQLQLPRKAKPRVKMPIGAVAIAQQQTAVYPSQSPGGWHIIGQTPISMVDYNDSGLKTAIKLGDQVNFYSISKSAFIELGGEVTDE